MRSNLGVEQNSAARFTTFGGIGLLQLAAAKRTASLQDQVVLDVSYSMQQRYTCMSYFTETTIIPEIRGIAFQPI